MSSSRVGNAEIVPFSDNAGRFDYDGTAGADDAAYAASPLCF